MSDLCTCGYPNGCMVHDGPRDPDRDEWKARAAQAEKVLAEVRAMFENAPLGLGGVALHRTFRDILDRHGFGGDA